MNYGRYFALDLEASCVEEGICVFNYTDLVETRVTGETKISPEYPIFVSITPSAVKFILQYCIYKVDNQSFLSFDEAVKASTDYNKIRISHMEEVLIHLPLNDASGSSISSIVKRLYTSPFPISIHKDKENTKSKENKKRKGYIQDLIASRYETAGSESKSGSNSKTNTYDILQDRDKSNVSYSSLDLWGLMSDSGFILYECVKEEPKYTKVLRKILLDFLFDMIHSDVFKNSVYYDDMYKALTEDFFCKSVIAKSEFYYQRTIINQLYSSKIWSQAEHNIYASYLDKAERDWVECIQDSRSDKEFEYIPQWYESASETNKSSRGISTTLFKRIVEFISPSFAISEHSWFVQPEKELQRVYFHLRNCTDRIVNTGDLATACNKTGAYNQFFSDDNELEDLSKRRETSSKWFFKRYDFADAYRLTFFPMSNLLLFVMASLVILLSITHNSYFDIIGGLERGISWLLDSNIRTWDQAPKIIKYTAWIFIAVTFAWILSYSVIKGRLISNRSIDFKLLWPAVRSGLISFVAVITISVLVVMIFKVSQWFLVPLIACIAILFKARVFNNALAYMHLTFPRLIASVSAAWISVGLSEDLYKAFFDSQWSPVSISLLFLMIFIFILYEVNKIVPRVATPVKLLRSLELMVFSFIISLGVGLVVINFTAERMLARSGYLPEYYRDHVLLKQSDRMTKDMVSLDFSSVDWKETVDKYTLDVLTKNDSISAVEVNRFIKAFAETKYESEYLDRIAVARESIADCEMIEISDTTKGMYLVRHENSYLFKHLLQHLWFTEKDHEHAVAKYVTINSSDGISKYKFFILYDFLIQFAVVAMFIGIFIQMIFEEKNLTES